MTKQVRLAISLGDPAGVGPEVVLKALPEVPHPCTVVGDRALIEAAAERLGLTVPERIHSPASAGCPGAVLFSGRASAEGGRAAAAAVREATRLVAAGEADALVTAPLNKEALGLAGEPFPGHTELLAAELGVPEVRMMLQGRGLRAVLVTIHVALRDVPALLTRERVVTTCRIASASLARFGVRPAGGAPPRLALAAFNPHAGEAGRFGREELDVLGPAVEACRAEGLDVAGPYPADTLFARAVQPGSEIDAVVALYHDQGLIPVKLHAFGGATNVTLGLPIVRTSPDHGTAYDIAGRGVADASSFVEACRVAAAAVQGGS
jgi:4-hydroxythreonine-4-phosphate dehydrogenase